MESPAGAQAQAVDDGPSCGAELRDTYHEAVARLEQGLLSGEYLLGGVGTRGPWLMVVESTGYTGTESYYDPDSLLLVARKAFSDVPRDDMGTHEWWVCGFIDCQPLLERRRHQGVNGGCNCDFDGWHVQCIVNELLGQ